MLCERTAPVAIGPWRAARGDRRARATSPEGTRFERVGDDRLLHRRIVGRGPLRVLRRIALCLPGAPAAPPRGGRRDRVGGSMGRLPRHRQLLVVQFGGGPLRDLPRSPRERRHQRDRRPLPRPAADARTHGHDGPAGAHPRASLADAVDDTETTQGQRGVHVAPRRPAARRVRRRRPVRVHRRLRAALRHAGGRRSARRTRGRPPTVPSGLRSERHGGRGRRR